MGIQKSGALPLATPSPTPTLPFVSDETTDWKTFKNDELSFKYPSSWKQDPYAGTPVFTANNPNIRLVVVTRNSTLMNECMKVDRVEARDNLVIKRFSKVTSGKMCSTNDTSTREIWVVPVENAYAPGISYTYSSEDSPDPESVFNQLLSTFKFLDPPEGKFCGGIAANLPQNQCPEGYYCKLAGNYPDASGVCVKR